MKRRHLMHGVLGTAATLAVMPAWSAAMPGRSGRLVSVFDPRTGPDGCGLWCAGDPDGVRGLPAEGDLLALLRLHVLLASRAVSGAGIHADPGDWRRFAATPSVVPLPASARLGEVHDLLCGLLAPESVAAALRWSIDETTRLALLTALVRESRASGRVLDEGVLITLADPAGRAVVYRRIEGGRRSVLVTSA